MNDKEMGKVIMWFRGLDDDEFANNFLDVLYRRLKGKDSVIYELYVNEQEFINKIVVEGVRNKADEDVEISFFTSKEMRSIIKKFDNFTENELYILIVGIMYDYMKKHERYEFKFNKYYLEDGADLYHFNLKGKLVMRKAVDLVV